MDEYSDKQKDYEKALKDRSSSLRVDRNMGEADIPGPRLQKLSSMALSLALVLGLIYLLFLLIILLKLLI